MAVLILDRSPSSLSRNKPNPNVRKLTCRAHCNVPLMVPGVRGVSLHDQCDIDWSTEVDFDSENLLAFSATVKKASVRRKGSRRSSRERSQGRSHSRQTLVRKANVCDGKNGAASPCDERSSEKAKTPTRERPTVLENVGRRQQPNARPKAKTDAAWETLDRPHSSVESLATLECKFGHIVGSLDSRSSRQEREHFDRSMQHKVQPTKVSLRNARDGKSESKSRARTKSLDRGRPLKGAECETKRRESSRRRPRVSSGLSQERGASSHSLDENALDPECRSTQSTSHKGVKRRPRTQSGALNADQVDPEIPPPSAMEVVFRSAYLAAYRSSSSQILVDDPSSDLSKRKQRNRERRRSMSGSSQTGSTYLCRTLLGDDPTKAMIEQSDHGLGFSSTQQATNPVGQPDQHVACRSSSSRSLLIDFRHKRLERRRSMNCSIAVKSTNKPGCLLGADPAEMTIDMGDCDLYFSNPTTAPDFVLDVTTQPMRSTEAIRIRRASMSHTGSSSGGQARVLRCNSMLTSWAIDTES